MDSKTPTTSNVIASRAFSNCCPGNTIGWPLIKPCNLPKAIKLPVKVRVPIKTEILMVEIVKVVISQPFKNSAAATNAEAPPPNPLKIATI